MPLDEGFDFARLFDPSPNASVVLDRELRIYAANNAYLALTGTTWEQLRRRTLFEVVPVVDHAALRASFTRVFATGQRDDLGSIAYLAHKHFTSITTPITEGNHTAWILHQVADVTALQHAPATIAQLGAAILGRASQTTEDLAVLRQLFDQAPGFVAFTRGPHHRFELANPAYLDLIGKGREVLGRTVEEALPEVRAQGFIDLLDRVYSTGEPFVGNDVEVTLARGTDGKPQRVVLDFVYQPIAVAGATVGIFVQGQDLTSKHRAEVERFRVAAEYRELIEIAPQQVWTAKPDGRLDTVNQQTVRYFGKPAAQIIGDGWQAVVHPDDLDATVAAWVHSLQTGELYQRNFRLRGADGVYRWHLSRATAVRGADGSIVSWIGTNTDIDEARQAHEELLRRSEYEEKLIGIVSHDLRNPLGTIALGISMIERDAMTPAATKAVGFMKAAASRAEHLISDLLDVAQARSGAFPIAPEPTNLPALIRAAVELAATYADRAATGAHTIHHGPATGVWDEGRLTQVIANLVGNAFQHAPANAEIRVESWIEGDRTRIDVFNAGSVIAVEDQTRLFDPFARGKNAQTKRGRSVGLGLYIARQITLAHGGELAVASTAEGVTFTVTLPTRTPR